MSSADLRRSLQRLGPLLPKFVDRRGEVIDGSRRADFCARHQIDLPTVTIKSSGVWPLIWALNPDKVTRAAFQGKPQAAAAECLSEPGTIAAWWAALEGQQHSESLQQRLARAFASAIAEHDQGIREMTPQLLVGIVRKTM